MGSSPETAAEDVTPTPRAMDKDELVTAEELIGILMNSDANEVPTTDRG